MLDPNDIAAYNNQQRNGILKGFEDEMSPEEFLEKGGKPAQLGERRQFATKWYQKIAGGWRLIAKGSHDHPEHAGFVGHHVPAGGAAAPSGAVDSPKTGSGKPIDINKHAADHTGFTREDHSDAIAYHTKQGKALAEMGLKAKSNKHYLRAGDHLNALNTMPKPAADPTPAKEKVERIPENDKRLLKHFKGDKDLSTPAAVTQHLKDEGIQFKCNKVEKQKNGDLAVHIGATSHMAFFGKDKAIATFTKAGYVVTNVKDISGGYAGTHNIILHKAKTQKELIAGIKQHSAVAKYNDDPLAIHDTSKPLKPPFKMEHVGGTTSLHDTWDKQRGELIGYRPGTNGATQYGNKTRAQVYESLKGLTAAPINTVVTFRGFYGKKMGPEHYQIKVGDAGSYTGSEHRTLTVNAASMEKIANGFK